jgi:hypothetical protein
VCARCDLDEPWTVALQWHPDIQLCSDCDDYDYGKREGADVDLDGNRIRFGAPLAN